MTYALFQIDFWKVRALLCKFVRVILVSGISLVVAACDESSEDDKSPRFSIGGPSSNSYFLGKSSPQNFTKARNEAQSCVWSRAKNCGVKIDAARVYARSDFDLHAISKMQIEYWEGQGNILTAQRTAVGLLRSLPGNSYATEFLRKHPPVPADIGLSRATLIGIGAIVLAAGQVGSAIAPSNATVNKPSQGASAQGFRINQTIRYSAGQNVVARGQCNKGGTFDVRYYPNNGGGARDHSIGGLFGSSVSDVAQKYCS